MITLLVISHLVFHRSLMATFVAIYLRLKYKPLMSSESRSRKYLEKRKTSPLGKVIVKGLKSNIKEEVFNDEQLFVIGENSDEVIIYLHGGAFAKNITKYHLKMIDKICVNTNRQIYLPIYKKIPQYCYKDVLADLKDLYVSLINKGKKIILMGDSAGGNLVFSLCLYLKDNGIKLPNKLIGLSPWIDLSMDKEKYINEKRDSMEGSKGARVFAQYYSGGANLKSPYISPTYGDLSNLSETLIVAGGRELLIEDIMLFVDKLTNNNVKVKLVKNDHMGHVYPAYPIKEARPALDMIYKFILKGE